LEREDLGKTAIFANAVGALTATCYGDRAPYTEQGRSLSAHQIPERMAIALFT